MESGLYLLAQGGFIVLTLVYVGLFILEFYKGVSRTSWEAGRKQRFSARMLVAVLFWGGFVSAWSATGMMADFSIFPLNLLPVLAVPLITAIFFIASPRTTEVLGHIPADNLIRLQSFRFFVEILLWVLFVEQVLPVQMTFEGRNFDILAGITAPLVATMAVRKKISRTGLILWNVCCLALLINIVSTALLSTPSPWRVFMNEPANEAVAFFPVSWLPGFLVPLAYYLHFLSLKQLLHKSLRQASVTSAEGMLQDAGRAG